MGDGGPWNEDKTQTPWDIGNRGQWYAGRGTWGTHESLGMWWIGNGRHTETMAGGRMEDLGMEGR